MKQLTVITPNEPGALADISAILAERDINIDHFDADAIDETGVIVLTVPLDAYDRALQALRAAGFQALTEDALLVRLDDKPGALAQIATRFKEGRINLRSMHIIRRQQGYSFVSIVADDRKQARELIADVLVPSRGRN